MSRLPFLIAIPLISCALSVRLAAGTPPEGCREWVLAGGAHAGDVIGGLPDGSVPAGLNPVTGTDGRLILTPVGVVLETGLGRAGAAVPFDSLGPATQAVVRGVSALTHLRSGGDDHGLAHAWLNQAEVLLARDAGCSPGSGADGEGARSSIAAARETLLTLTPGPAWEDRLNEAVEWARRAARGLLEGPAPAGPGSQGLTLSQSTIDWGPVAVGDAPELETRVTNNSGVDLPLIVRTRGVRSPFSVTADGFRITLSPGQMLIVNAVFAPARPGTFADSFRIVSSGFPGGSAVVNLRGVGIPTLLVTPAPVDCGRVRVGASSTAQPTVRNQATRRCRVDLSLSPHRNGDSSSFTVSPAQIADIPSGSTAQAGVTFRPTSFGPHTAKLELTAHMTRDGRQIESLTEVGVAGVGVRPLDVDGSLEFGVVPRGVFHTRTLTLRNTTTDMTISGTADFSGVDREFFSITNDGEFTLGPGASKTITCVFFASGRCNHMYRAKVKTLPAPGVVTGVIVSARTR